MGAVRAQFGPHALRYMLGTTPSALRPTVGGPYA